MEVPNSAHAKDGEDALGSVVAAMLGFFTGDRATLFGHAMSFADRPHVWERALGTPLSNPETSGDARSAVEILTLKGTRAAHAMLGRFGRERVGELLGGLREMFAGETYRAEEFEAVGAAMGASPKSILGDWLNSKVAPGFLVSPVEVVRLDDDHSGKSTATRHACTSGTTNRRRVPCFWAWTVKLGWNGPIRFRVPGHTSVEVGMVMPEPPSQLWLHSYFSMNRIPVRLGLPAKGGPRCNGVRGVGWRGAERLAAGDARRDRYRRS